MTSLIIETSLSKEAVSYMNREHLLPFHMQKNPPSWFKDMPASEQWTEANKMGRFELGSYTYKSCIGLTHWLGNCISIPSPTDIEFSRNEHGEWDVSIESDEFISVGGFDTTTHKQFSLFLTRNEWNPEVFKITFPYNIKLKSNKISWFKKFFKKNYVNAYVIHPFFETVNLDWYMIPGCMPVWGDDELALRLTLFYVLKRGVSYVKMDRGDIIGNLLINRNITDKLNIEFISREINDFGKRNNESFQLLAATGNKKAKIFNEMIKGKCPI